MESNKRAEELYKTHFVRLAKYHHWAYTKVIKQLESISDTDYKKDIGLFFQSIHCTLNRTSSTFFHFAFVFLG